MSKKNKRNRQPGRYDDDEEINQSIRQLKGQESESEEEEEEGEEQDQDNDLEEEESLVHVEGSSSFTYIGDGDDIKDEDKAQQEATVEQSSQIFQRPSRIPACGCCKVEWGFDIKTGRITGPTCGCAIQPKCSICKTCELHCVHLHPELAKNKESAA